MNINIFNQINLWNALTLTLKSRKSTLTHFIFDNVQIPLGGPDQTLSETHRCQRRPRSPTKSIGLHVSLTSPQTLSGHVWPVRWNFARTRPYCRWSGLVVSFLKSTTQTWPDPTGYVCACEQVSDKVWSMLNSTAQTHRLCLRPDQTRPTNNPQTKSVHVEIQRTSLRLDKVCGLVGQPSCPWV